MKIHRWINHKPRTFGILLGAILLFPPIYFFVYPGEMIMNTLFVLLLFLDWYFQKSLIYQSKIVTFVVSIVAGYGLASIIVMQTVFIILLLL
jgi:hypothetical protein